MGKVWVQVCASNPSAKHTGLLDLRDQDPERYGVEVVSCLDRCTLCELFAFALVNGLLLTAETPADLVEQVRRQQPADSPPAPVPAGGGDCTHPHGASE